MTLNLECEPLRGTVLIPGDATGLYLALQAPLSFWGGTDEQGVVVDRNHPQCGVSLAGRVIGMRTGKGSSSSSSVLAEQIRKGVGPAAILIEEPDPIIVLGALVAAELYGTSVPVVLVDPAFKDACAAGTNLHVHAGNPEAVLTAIPPRFQAGPPSTISPEER